MSQPKKEHWDAVLMVHRYLKSSPRKGLLFIKGKSLDITFYSDANYARSIDDRKFTMWLCVFVGDNLVHRKVKNKQL